MSNDSHTENPSITVDSLSGRDASYQVDLHSLECTCEEWRENRSRFDAGDLRRCCKHLVYALARDPQHGPKALAGQPRTISRLKRLAAQREGFPLCRRIVPVAIPQGPEGKEASADLFFPLDPETTPWVTVLIGAAAFRYHPAEDRWANGEPPPDPVREALELRIHKAMIQEQTARTAAEGTPCGPTAQQAGAAQTPQAAVKSEARTVDHAAAPTTGPAGPEPLPDTEPSAQKKSRPYRRKKSAAAQASRPRKAVRFDTPGEADEPMRRRRTRRGLLIFLVILLGGVLYLADTITMPPPGKEAEGPVISNETPMPGAAGANGTDFGVQDPLEPPLPEESVQPNTSPQSSAAPTQGQASQNQTAPGQAASAPTGPPAQAAPQNRPGDISNAALAADLLKLIERDPNRGRYTISRRVPDGTLLFGADLDLDVIFRIVRGNDGSERRDRWIGHITHRLQSAAAGGSLDSVPAQ